MEYTNSNSVIDQVAIMNRARQLRAEAAAEMARGFSAWVARHWAGLTHRTGHQSA